MTTQEMDGIRAEIIRERFAIDGMDVLEHEEKLVAVNPYLRAVGLLSSGETLCRSFVSADI